MGSAAMKSNTPEKSDLGNPKFHVSLWLASVMEPQTTQPSHAARALTVSLTCATRESRPKTDWCGFLIPPRSQVSLQCHNSHLKKLGSVHITLLCYVACSFCFQFLSVLGNLEFDFSKLSSAAFVHFRDSRCIGGNNRWLFDSVRGIFFDRRSVE